MNILWFRIGSRVENPIRLDGWNKIINNTNNLVLEHTIHKLRDYNYDIVDFNFGYKIYNEVCNLE